MSEPSPAKSPGTDWGLLVLLIAGYTVYNIDKNIIAILVEPLKAEFGLTDAQLGLLTGLAATAPFAITCIPLGLLADRANRKRLLVVLMIGWSLMTGLAGVATNVGMLFLSRVGIGAFEGGYSPISMSLIADSFDRRRRATAMGSFNIGGALGVCLGLAIGGILAQQFGWRAAFFIAGVPGLIVAGLIALIAHEPVRGRYDPPAADQAASIGAIFANIWKERALFHVGMGMLLGMTMINAFHIWMPSFFMRVHHLSLSQAGLIAAVIVGVFGTMGSLAGGLLADRLYARAPWMRLGAGVAGLGLAVLATLLALLWAASIWVTATLLAAAIFFGQWQGGAAYATVAGLTPTRMRSGTMSILLVSVNLISVGAGSVMVGWVSDLATDYAGTNAVGVGMVFAALLALVGAGHFSRAMVLIRRKDGPMAAAEADAPAR